MPLFPKSERLSNQKIIENLFSNGTRLLVHPFLVHYILSEDHRGGADILIVIPKRFLKQAVDRNRVKRLLRETYRLQKDNFLSKINLTDERLHFSVSLIAKTIPTFDTTNVCMQNILLIITKKIHSK